MDFDEAFKLLSAAEDAAKPRRDQTHMPTMSAEIRVDRIVGRKRRARAGTPTVDQTADALLAEVMRDFDADFDRAFGPPAKR